MEDIINSLREENDRFILILKLFEVSSTFLEASMMENQNIFFPQFNRILFMIYLTQRGQVTLSGHKVSIIVILGTNV